MPRGPTRSEATGNRCLLAYTMLCCDVCDTEANAAVSESVTSAVEVVEEVQSVSEVKEETPDEGL